MPEPTTEQVLEALRVYPPHAAGLLVLDALPDADRMDPYLRFVLSNLAETRREIDIFDGPPPPADEEALLIVLNRAQRLQQLYLGDHTRRDVREAVLMLLAYSCRFLEQYDRSDRQHLSRYGLT